MPSLLSKINAELNRYKKRRALKLQLSSLTLPKIAIRFRGGIGDILNSTRFLRDLFAEAGAFEYDLYTTRVDFAKWATAALPPAAHVFSEYNWHEMHRRYFLSIDVIGFVAISHLDGPAAALLPQKLLEIVRHIMDARHLIEPCVSLHPRLDNNLGRIAVLTGFGRRNYMHAMAQIPYGGDKLGLNIDDTILDTCRLRDRPFLTFHNGFDTTKWGAQNSTKVYPHFSKVVETIMEAYPGVATVQIGAASTSRPIRGVDHDLRDKTSLPQAAALLKAAVLHLDNESGLVHLGSCVGAQSAVFFGPTDVKYFGYAQNINFAPAACGDCWWLTEDWNARCAAGHAQPICLDELRPQEVLMRINPVLQRRMNYATAPRISADETKDSAACE